MSGFFGDFFNSSTDFKLPDWMKQNDLSLSGRANDLLNRPFTPYHGEMVAPMVGAQTDAMNYIRHMLSGNNFMTPRLVDNIPGPNGKGGGSLQDYMNPYTQQVLDPTLREIRLNTDKALMQDDARAQFTGGFRDTGHALQRSEDTRLGTQEVGDATNQAYSQAFNTAMANRNLDINRLIQNRQDAVSTAGMQFDMGSKQQATEQMADTARFQEFLRRTGWDMDTFMKVASVLNGMNPGQMTQTGSPAGQIGGLLGGLGGLGTLISSIF